MVQDWRDYIIVQIGKETKDELFAIARKEGKTMTAKVRELICECIEREGRQ